MAKYTFGSFPSNLKTKKSLFFCCASYEERCLNSANNISQLEIMPILFQYDEFAEFSNNNCKAMECLLKTSSIMLKNSDPVFTFRMMDQALREHLNAGIASIIVDITTFTREGLLFLIKLLSYHKSQFDDCTLVYNSSNSYVPSWLSLGIEDIRSVLGYPGNIIPTKGDCLIILPGFEVERVQKIIESCEPTLIKIGTASKECSINTELYAYAQKYLAEIFSSGAEEQSTFHIDITNPFETLESLNQQVSQYSEDYNVIIVPMNTKLSTVGAGICCLENKNVQLLYTQATKYNIDGFFKASNEFYFYDLPRSML